MFIGAFLFGAAWSTRRQASLRLALNATCVRDVMIRAVVTIPSQLSLQAAVDEFFVAYGYGSFPVAEEGRVVGLITVQDVQAISQGLWTWRTVADVMRPASPELFIQPEWSIMQAMELMVRTGFDRPIWTLPWVGILGGYFYLRYWGATASTLSEARLQRAERYARALKPIGKESSYEFCRRLTFMTLIASLLFALCLPIILMDFYRVTFKFFCVVYGFLLVVHLVRIAIAQNISIARAE